MYRLAIVALAVVAAACGSNQTPAPAASAPALTPAAGAPAGSAAGSTAGADAGTIRGAVAETMNSGGYTYARLTVDGKDTWIAGSEFPVKVGDQLTAAVDMPMENFRSRTLNRDFPVIYFVREVALNGQALPASAADGAMPALAGSHGGGEAVPAAEEPEEPKLIAAVAFFFQFLNGAGIHGLPILGKKLDRVRRPQGAGGGVARPPFKGGWGRLMSRGRSPSRGVFMPPGP